MLKLLRNKKMAKKIWIALAIMVLPAFLFWGFGSISSDQKRSGYAGEIFGKKITNTEYNDSLVAARNLAIIRYGDKFFEAENQLNLKGQAWQRLILLHEAKERKIRASDREVIELIESYPFFQYKGVFDNRIYKDMLQYIFKTQPRAFEEQTRQNILISKLYDQVTKDVKISDADLRVAYAKAKSEGKKDYKLDEKKYQAEKDNFSLVVIAGKKEELFDEFVAGLANKAQIK